MTLESIIENGFNLIIIMIIKVLGLNFTWAREQRLGHT